MTSGFNLIFIHQPKDISLQKKCIAQKIVSEDYSFVDAYGRFTAKLQGGGDVRNMSFLGVSETLSAPSYSKSYIIHRIAHPLLLSYPQSCKGNENQFVENMV